MIELQQISKRFGKTLALDQIDLCLQERTYGLLGPHHAGKTTLIRTLLGVYLPSRGKVLLDGQTVRKRRQLAHQIGYLPQQFAMFDGLCVEEALTYFYALKKMPPQQIDEEVERCLKIAHLQQFRHQKVGTLASGLMWRLGIAQALLGDPQLLVIDGPIDHMDREDRVYFKDVVAAVKKGHTVLVSARTADDIEAICDEVIVMKQGRVIWSGSSCQLRDVAEGHVLVVPSADRDLLRGNYWVADIFEGDNEQWLRVLSGERQPVGKQAEPTVEDGYMCLVKEI